MKDFLYLQYLVVRPMGVAPDDKDFDRKAEFALHNIMDDERQAIRLPLMAGTHRST